MWENGVLVNECAIIGVSETRRSVCLSLSPSRTHTHALAQTRLA